MKYFGVALMLLGMGLGLYVGFFVMLVGWMVQTLSAFQQPDPDTAFVAFGLLKMVFSTLFGFLSAAFFVIPGFIIYKNFLDR